MHVRSGIAICLCIPALVCLQPHAAEAGTAERLLPNTTRAFIVVDNAAELEAAWRTIPWGQLADSKAMQPFVEEADHYFQEFVLPGFEKTTGTTIDDLREVATGEMSGALVDPGDGPAVTMIVIDVRGKESEAQTLLTEVADRFAQRSATAGSVQRDSVEIKTWAWKSDTDVDRVSTWLLKDGILLFSTSLSESEGALKRWNQPETSLSSLPSYQKSMASCQAGTGTSPTLRWFVDPVGLVRLVHKPGPFDEPEDHPAEFAKRHGLDAVRAIAGTVTGAIDPFDLLVRVGIHAPKPHRGTMAIFDFPDGKDVTVADWVPDDVNMLTSLHFNLTTAFDNLGGLFDDLYADGIEGTFNDIMNDLKADDGPRVDVRKDVIANLGSRITILNESIQPIAGKNEHSLVSVDIDNDAEGVAQAVKRMLRDDPGVKRYRVPGFSNDLWTIGESEDRDDDEGAPRLRTLAVMVAQKQLLIATNVVAIRNVLTRRGVKPLAESEEYHQVSAAIAKLEANRTIGRASSSLSRDIETTYELIRTGRTDEMESVYGMFAGMAIKRFRDAETGDSRIDFTKLPAFDGIRQYFGRAGLVGEHVADGWRVTVFTLSNNEVPR